MGQNWYARPILYVADMERALAFYIGKLGFSESWRHDEEGQTEVAQVERLGCDLIFSCQDQMKAGPGRVFISLDPDVLDAVRREYEARGVGIREGHWGYQTMIVADVDGNELYFPYASSRRRSAPVSRRRSRS